MEVRNVFTLIENAAGDAILNIRGERLRLLQIAWVVTIGVCIEVPVQEIFVRRETIVSTAKIRGVRDLDNGYVASGQTILQISKFAARKLAPELTPGGAAPTGETLTNLRLTNSPNPSSDSSRP
jgi:hypothetical protein